MMYNGNSRTINGAAVKFHSRVLVKMELELKSTMSKWIESLMPEGAAAACLLLGIQGIITGVEL